MHFIIATDRDRMQDLRNKDSTMDSAVDALCSIFQNGHNIESHCHLTAWEDQQMMDFVLERFRSTLHLVDITLERYLDLVMRW